MFTGPNYLSQLLLVILLLLSPFRVSADSEPSTPLTIADPFIELRTGPGSSYPIFHVVDRGEQIVILRQKTNWFKIRASNGKEGWADKDQMQQTLLPSGEKLQISELDQAAFVERRWELGVLTGELKNAPITSIYGAYAFTRNFSTEFSLGHSVGNVSSSLLYKFNLLMQPFPQWEYSPFFTLGLGRIEVDPKATLIDPLNKNNQVGQVGFGVRTYLSRRFIARFEVNEYVVFSATNELDDNEEITEWKIGFAIFF